MDNVKELQERVGKAFRALRAEGFLAKQNYLCCSECAVDALDAQVEKIEDRGKKCVRGLIFYCSQAHAHMLETGQLSIDCAPTEFNCSSSQYDIAKSLYSALVCAGLKVFWDGDPKNKVRVTTMDREFKEPTPDPISVPELQEVTA